MMCNAQLYPGRYRLVSSYLGMYFRKSHVILRNFLMRVEDVQRVHRVVGFQAGIGLMTCNAQLYPQRFVMLSSLQGMYLRKTQVVSRNLPPSRYVFQKEPCYIEEPSHENQRYGVFRNQKVGIVYMQCTFIPTVACSAPVCFFCIFYKHTLSRFEFFSLTNPCFKLGM